MMVFWERVLQARRRRESEVGERVEAIWAKTMVGSERRVVGFGWG